MASAEHEPSGGTGKRRTAGHERHLRFAHRTADRLPSILCSFLDCVPGGVDPSGPVRRRFAPATGT
jgi:hypothetical protein